MKRFLLVWLLLATSLAGLWPEPGKAQPSAVRSLEGSWSGTLVQGRDQVPVTVNIFRTANGQILGSVIGIQGNDVIMIDAVEQKGDQVKLIIGTIGGGFEAMLSGDGARLTGTWSEIAITQPLELTRSATSPSAAASPAKPG